MDVATFLRILVAQALLHGIAWALENVVNLQIPYAPLIVPIIAVGLNAAAAWIRAQFGVEAARKVARATKPGDPPLFAKVF